MQSKSTLEGTLTTPESEYEEVLVTLENAKEVVAKRDALLRLTENKDFIKIVREGYFKDEAVRLTSVINSPMVDEDAVVSDIKAICAFRQYLDLILQQGDQMAQQIQEYEALMDEEGIEAFEEEDDQ